MRSIRAVLGAAVTDASAGEGSPLTVGATLGHITPGSGAAAAGLQPGNIVTAVNDRPIETADALVAAVRSVGPNGTVTLTDTRSGISATVPVTLGSTTAG